LIEAIVFRRFKAVATKLVPKMHDLSAVVHTKSNYKKHSKETYFLRYCSAWASQTDRDIGMWLTEGRLRLGQLSLGASSTVTRMPRTKVPPEIKRLSVK